MKVDMTTTCGIVMAEIIIKAAIEKVILIKLRAMR